MGRGPGPRLRAAAPISQTRQRRPDPLRLGENVRTHGEYRRDHPLLSPLSRAARHIEARRSELETLARKLDGSLELVPSHEAVYVFFGGPQDGDFAFGWVGPGGFRSMRGVLDAIGASSTAADRITDRLRQSYRGHLAEDRFVLPLGGRSVVVVPSEGLAVELRNAIRELWA
jgi:hypothetical protein